MSLLRIFARDYNSEAEYLNYLRSHVYDFKNRDFEIVKNKLNRLASEDSRSNFRVSVWR